MIQSNLAEVLIENTVPDVQGRVDTREIAIQKVGVRDVRIPIRVREPSGEHQNTVSVASIYVDLAAKQKGTHMSRFIELVGRGGFEVDYRSLCGLLDSITACQQAESGFIELSFNYFINKQAPITGIESLLDYAVHLSGKRINGSPQINLQVAVPVTSLCPCSKAISRYGAHNQRSRVTVDVKTDGRIWIEDIIRLVEEEASCELYALLKREDERYITEKAYDNPKFVEDMIRDIAARLNQDERVSSYTIQCENFESIHNHSAYALITNVESNQDNGDLGPMNLSDA